MRHPSGEDNSIILVDKFIQATRDSGYKGTASAVAELVDNALQANATRVQVVIEESGDERYPLQMAVIDDGAGMTPGTLRQALRFGFSTRFGRREGLGRYGLGLPNSSLSQARRVDVMTWRTPRQTHRCYIDVDEIAEGRMREVPAPTSSAGELRRTKSGTVVLWSRCDRLDNRRISTLERKLHPFLGRVFRYFIWRGVNIEVNGRPVRGVDPLYLRLDSATSGAAPFGDQMTYEVERGTNGHAGVGQVTVMFSELPVRRWHALSNAEKQRLGIAKGAGVSVVRAEREIDYGWFFLKGKRRENYDDWWRCEVRFEPVLDELFGITHTKQQIRPAAELMEAIGEDIEATARALNSRARKAHFAVRAEAAARPVEAVAASKDHLLTPLPARRNGVGADRLLAQARAAAADVGAKTAYAVDRKKLRGRALFEGRASADTLALTINTSHSLWRRLQRSLDGVERSCADEVRRTVELLLLAAARAEATQNTTKREREVLQRFRGEWGATLDALLGR